MKPQPRIAFLIRSLNVGGAERQLTTMACGLRQRGYPVRVISFYPGGPLAEELRASGVPVQSPGKRWRWDIAAFLVSLIRLLREDPPEVLHSYLPVANILAALLKPLLPDTRIVWGIRASQMDLARYDWPDRVMDVVQRVLAPCADLIIVNSQAGQAYAATRGYPEDRMIVIPNGINTQIFQPDPVGRRRIREEWGIREQQTLIGMAARLDPMKDHPTFLRAAAHLARRHRECHFVCIGSGPEAYLRELRDLAGELGIADRITWAGARSDMPAVYNALDIFTLSSYGEGFPNVVGEALACGTYSVVTDAGDCAWILGETVGDSGCVVPPRSPEALAAAWEQRMEKQRTKTHGGTGTQGRARILQHFTVDQLLDRTEEALCPAA